MGGVHGLFDRVFRQWWQVLAPISLIFLGYPLRLAIQSGPWAPESLLSYGGAIAFAAAFLVLMCWIRPARLVVGRVSTAGGWLRRGLIIALVVLVVLMVQFASPSWLSLFFHVGVAMGVMLPAREAYPGLVGLALVILIVGWPYGLSFIGLPAGVLGLWAAATVGQTATVAELTNARRRLAELAVAEERLRFARDLHDLLGHSLSLISLKTELGERLIDADPARARTEIHDAHEVARRSLREVREAVAGYRQPTLSSELDGAAEMLESAGVAARIDDQLNGRPVQHGVLLAWAVREAVTNVVRHSGAQTCAIELRWDEETICLAVSDDGRGGPAPVLDPGSVTDQAAARDLGWNGPSSRGSGLVGLAERVRQVAGATLTTENLEPGFRLRVCVPTETGGAG
ncbi:sensor histidine kinase [Microlunatus speluncae]|uniref:sensor histidine kinase n=1 Tax=Microlunatus speluncae TaxID=2594267 RepID=UPI00126609D9|nr:histidine kinase [Microlunatus speluncae]